MNIFKITILMKTKKVNYLLKYFITLEKLYNI